MKIHISLKTHIRTTNLRGIVAALAFPLLLAGCYAPHVVDSQDAIYCEHQGFRPGTDANYNCASDREAEREQGTVPPLDPLPPPKPFLSAEPPPNHVGGVAQETPRTVPPETTRLINFTIAVNEKCEQVGLPTVKFLMRPANGVVRLIHLTDFARLSQIGAPASCADKKVAGVGLIYTPKANFGGDDMVEFNVTTPAGRTDFKVPITVEDPDDDDD